MRKDYFASRGLSKIIALVGEEKALLLTEHAAGNWIDIPSSLSDTHKIVQMIGYEAAEKLVDYCRGTPLFIPRALDWRIQQYEKQGLSARIISLKVGCGVNTVYNKRRLFAAKAEKDRQLSLLP